MQVNDLQFTQTDGSWTLTDDPDYPVSQSSIKKMASTILQMQTAWTVTAPEADTAYGLDSPDVTAVLTFTDGTSLTVRFGNAVAAAADGSDGDSLCYLASDAAPTVVYEVNADSKLALRGDKGKLIRGNGHRRDRRQRPGGAVPRRRGEDDYADSLPE